MSELFINGLFIVGTCIAGLGAAALATAEAMKRIINALPEDAKKTYDELVKLVEANDENEISTPKEALENAKSNMKKLSQFSMSKVNNIDLNRMRNLAVMNTSPLRYYLNEEGLKNLHQLDDEKSFQRLLKNASKTMQKIQFDEVNKRIIQTTSEEGFTTQKFNNVNDRVGLFSLADSDGRAVIVKTFSSSNGVKIDMDITGFPKGECHRVMDRILEKLQNKGITIRSGERIPRESRSLKNGQKGKTSQKNKRSTSSRSVMKQRTKVLVD